ncbi:aminotransferase class III-fold pyridoxal phosphate-dependent enzyme [Rhodohalobacter sulfatireducens]|uniref:Aminotransferase class III-fold pyridoxal phosphate-dependent enzyme n=1 Tax=Rhodohalobacter sulfatireducens TaxID=2911366 RepID=A0ABS9KG20_9BACT|nr:aminotransferase class III-fold pyridoxal phosphate-dependent enzyme [Rhodohalobacter sulfatireducens]MCG2589814.1 aminotransferase class III-fold pyridoxal phosphate-dependent enzyme [Rhodohalobacter sulfatireducens]
MKNLIQKRYGFEPSSIKKLAGYNNANYLITDRNDRFILKTYPYTRETFNLLEAENEILYALQSSFRGSIPEPIAISSGDDLDIADLDGQKTIYRMLTYLEGEFLGDIPANPKVYASLGRFLARMDKDLNSLSHPDIQSRQWEWDIQYLHLNKPLIEAIPSARDRSIVRYFFQQFDEVVVPELPNLRKSIIHNDANEWNVLTKNHEISGIIDFGDLAYSPLINELAVAITYAIYDKDDPLEWACIILKAYHEINPLEELELHLLYYLIAARLCISVCNSAQSRLDQPDNRYALSSEKKAWELFKRWLGIHPKGAENRFKKSLNITVQPPPEIENRLEKRFKSISKALSISYKKPIYMEKAAFQYMYDAYGNSFLDAYNNIPHVGHSHPKVVKAGQKQMARLNTNTRYLYDLLPEYAERLLETFPPSLNKVFFVNSGSAASDLAIRMARHYTGADTMMVLEHGYHGNTLIGTDISDYKFSDPKGQGQKAHILKTAIPDTYHGRYTKNDGTAGAAYAEDSIRQIENSAESIAAFISEPIVGCGGQVPLAKGYLQEIYPAIRKQNGVTISDEVQTGFGRLGDYYWGFEAQNVIPDMVILGKPMCNGHPVGAVVCTDEIAESFSHGVEFFSSFGGNPVTCAIGLSVLDVIEEEELQQHAKAVGDYYKSLFLELQKEHNCIGDVRGSGLFLGVEMVKPGSKEPDTQLAQRLKNELRNLHVLVSTDGPFDNVIKSKPPLIFNRYNAQEVTEKMNQILRSM